MDEKINFGAVLFGVIALLFNPIFPVYLQDKEIWTTIDLLSAISFVGAGIYLNNKAKKKKVMSTRELTFRKIDGTWYFEVANEQPSSRYEMPVSTIAILEFAAKGKGQVRFRLLRKNTLERVKLSLGRVRYLKGGALYYELDYTGALYRTKAIGRKKIWIGSATRKVLNNFPEVINLTW